MNKRGRQRLKWNELGLAILSFLLPCFEWWLLDNMLSSMSCILCTNQVIHEYSYQVAQFWKIAIGLRTVKENFLFYNNAWLWVRVLETTSCRNAEKCYAHKTKWLDPSLDPMQAGATCTWLPLAKPGYIVLVYAIWLSLNLKKIPGT
jgi:hypothetical protein